METKQNIDIYGYQTLSLCEHVGIEVSCLAPWTPTAEPLNNFEKFLKWHTGSQAETTMSYMIHASVDWSSGPPLIVYPLLAVLKVLNPSISPPPLQVSLMALLAKFDHVLLQELLLPLQVQYSMHWMTPITWLPASPSSLWIGIHSWITSPIELELELHEFKRYQMHIPPYACRSCWCWMLSRQLKAREMAIPRSTMFIRWILPAAVEMDTVAWSSKSFTSQVLAVNSWAPYLLSTWKQSKKFHSQPE